MHYQVKKRKRTLRVLSRLFPGLRYIVLTEGFSYLELVIAEKGRVLLPYLEYERIETGEIKVDPNGSPYGGNNVVYLTRGQTPKERSATLSEYKKEVKALLKEKCLTK